MLSGSLAELNSFSKAKNDISFHNRLEQVSRLIRSVQA